MKKWLNGQQGTTDVQAQQQEKALELLNIPLPFPDKKQGKYNNRKQHLNQSDSSAIFMQRKGKNGRKQKILLFKAKGKFL